MVQWVQCTWAALDKQCPNPGTVEQRATDDTVWAILCIEHDRELLAAIDALDVKALLRCYVRAQGGAKAATARTLGKMGISAPRGK